MAARKVLVVRSSYANQELPIPIEGQLPMLCRVEDEAMPAEDEATGEAFALALSNANVVAVQNRTYLTVFIAPRAGRVSGVRVRIRSYGFEDLSPGIYDDAGNLIASGPAVMGGVGLFAMLFSSPVQLLKQRAYYLAAAVGVGPGGTTFGGAGSSSGLSGPPYQAAFTNSILPANFGVPTQSTTAVWMEAI